MLRLRDEIQRGAKTTGALASVSAASSLTSAPTLSLPIFESLLRLYDRYRPHAIPVLVWLLRSIANPDTAASAPAMGNGGPSATAVTASPPPAPARTLSLNSTPVAPPQSSQGSSNLPLPFTSPHSATNNNPTSGTIASSSGPVTGSAAPILSGSFAAAPFSVAVPRLSALLCHASFPQPGAPDPALTTLVRCRRD